MANEAVHDGAGDVDGGIVGVDDVIVDDVADVAGEAVDDVSVDVAASVVDVVALFADVDSWVAPRAHVCVSARTCDHDFACALV